MSNALQGRVILVTGGGAGIGRGVVLSCLDAGAQVVVGTLEEPVDLPQDDRVIVLQLDVTQPRSITQWVDAAVVKHGQVDGLVANAGITLTPPFLEAGLDELDTLWQVNQRGVFLSVQAVARHMVARGNAGSIVTIASNHAVASDSGYEMYAATKAGIVAMSRAMAWSLGKHDIRVNSLSPGLTRTEKVGARMEAEPEIDARFCAMHATGQYNEVREVGDCAVFLLSDASSAVTGSDLLADRGMSARLGEFP